MAYANCYSVRTKDKQDVSCLDSDPPPLLELCVRFISRNPEIISKLAVADPSFSSKSFCLRRGLHFPLPVSQSLLSAFKEANCQSGIDHKHLYLFVDRQSTPFVALDLTKSRVDDLMLNWLLKAHGDHLEYLNLRDCNELSCARIPSTSLKNLKILNLGNQLILFSDWLNRFEESQPKQHVSRCDQSDSNDVQMPDSEQEASVDAIIVDDSNKLACDERIGFPNFHLDNFEFADTVIAENFPELSEIDVPDSVSTAAAPSFGETLQLELGDESPLNSGGEGSSNKNAAESSGGAEEAARVRKSSVYSAPVELMQLRACKSAEEQQAAETVFRMSLKRRAPSIGENSKTTPLKMLPKYRITQLCPNLLALVLHGQNWEDFFPESDNEQGGPPPGQSSFEFLEFFLSPLKQLLYLDLSYWDGLRDLACLRPHLCQTLHAVILYNVPNLYRAVDTICELQSLRVLDISQSHVESGQYPLPVTTLYHISSSLTFLEVLDISCTNLANIPSESDWPSQAKEETNVKSDIVGLRGLSRPLKYLGLFNCDAAAHYRQIPSESVTGDANEAQILLAIESYIARPALLHRVLNEAYQVYRNGEPRFHARALGLVLDTMEYHLDDANVQICCSAAIFYIIKNLVISYGVKRRLIEAFLKALEVHSDEQVLVRNCCLSLCHFDIPADLLFDYQRAIRTLLRILSDHSDDPTTQRIVAFLLNSMACHVEGEQKILVGDLGAVEICALIQQRLEAGECDEVMEVSWSFLWNITDETWTNCQRFLNSRGMEMLSKCFEIFPDKKELIRNMMGLMGNIAEVKCLRFELMRKEYISIFVRLLEDYSDGIEISYNSAGVLAHLLSDGTIAWTIKSPSREEVTASVIAATQNWKLDMRRFINYRSFAPILRLVGLYDCVASQQWAVWALANLTTVDTTKYCEFVVNEGGVPLLQDILNRPDSSEEIKKLSRHVLENVWKWQSKREKKGADRGETSSLGAAGSSAASAQEENRPSSV